MSLLQSLLNPQQPTEAEQIQALLQGGGPNALNSSPVPQLDYTPVPQQAMASLPIQSRAPQPQGELAALDYAGPQGQVQAPAAPMVEAPAAQEAPSTLKQFLMSQMATLGDPTELEKKSQQEEANSQEILAQLNANAGATPIATELLTAIAALAPAFINKGSGADAALNSYNLGRKQLKDDEAVKRNLLTDRFKISQGKIDRYDTKAAGINQAKTSLMGQLYASEENRLSREEMARERMAQASEMARDRMNMAWAIANLNNSRRGGDNSTPIGPSGIPLAREVTKMAGIEMSDEQMAQMTYGQMDQYQRLVQAKGQADAEKRRVVGQAIKATEQEMKQTGKGVLARIPGMAVEEKLSKQALELASNSAVLVEHLDNYESVLKTGKTLDGEEVGIEKRDARLASIADLIKFKVKLAYQLGQNFTDSEQLMTSNVAGLVNPSTDLSEYIKDALTGKGNKADAVRVFRKAVDQDAHSTLNMQGWFIPGQGIRASDRALKTIEGRILPNQMEAFRSMAIEGITNNPYKLEGGFEDRVNASLAARGLSPTGEKLGESAVSQKKLPASDFIPGKTYQTNAGNKVYRGTDDQGNMVWE